MDKPSNTTAQTNHKNGKNRTHIPVEGYKIEDLRVKPLEELLELADKLNVENPHQLKRQDLMF